MVAVRNKPHHLSISSRRLNLGGRWWAGKCWWLFQGCPDVTVACQKVGQNLGLLELPLGIESHLSLLSLSSSATGLP